MSSAERSCAACALIPVPSDPGDDRYLYCSRVSGHSGLHYDSGAGVSWKAGMPDE